jgi:hypothetical protein
MNMRWAPYKQENGIALLFFFFPVRKQITQCSGPLNCDRFTGPPLNWLLNTVVGHSNYSTDVNSLGSTQGRGTQPKLFVKMASDDHVMGGSAAACPNQASPIAPLCLDNQRAALQAKVSGAIFGNYYLHNAPH